MGKPIMFKGCYNGCWRRAPPGKGRAQLSSLSAGGGAIGGGGGMSHVKYQEIVSLFY